MMADLMLHGTPGSAADAGKSKAGFSRTTTPLASPRSAAPPAAPSPASASGLASGAAGSTATVPVKSSPLAGGVSRTMSHVAATPSPLSAGAGGSTMKRPTRGSDVARGTSIEGTGCRQCSGRVLLICCPCQAVRAHVRHCVSPSCLSVGQSYLLVCKSRSTRQTALPARCEFAAFYLSFIML